MKKLTLLICALSIVLGVSANTRSREVKNINDVRRTEQNAHIDQRRGMKPVKHFRDIQKRSNAAKAPKAIQETYTVNVASVDYDVESWYDYETYTDLPAVNYKIFNADSSKVFKFYIILEVGMSDVKSGKTYTIDDMSQWSSYWENPNSPMEYGNFTEATFTKTVATDGTYTLVASATDDSGDTYNISYKGQPYVPQVYNVTIAKTSHAYYKETQEMVYQLLDADDKYAFYFDIYIAEGLKDVESGKTYTLADMSSFNTYGYNFAEYENLYFASASFTKTVAPDKSLTIVASATTYKGDTYNLSYSQDAPTTRNASLTLNGTFMQNEYMWMLSAADEDTTVYVSLVVYEAFEAGTYTEDELNGYYTFIATYGADTTYFNLLEASINITANEDTYTATGTMLVANENDPTDQVLYTLNLTATEVEVPQGGEDNIYPKEAETDFNQTFSSYDIDDSYLDVDKISIL